MPIWENGIGRGCLVLGSRLMPTTIATTYSVPVCVATHAMLFQLAEVGFFKTETSPLFSCATTRW